MWDSSRTGEGFCLLYLVQRAPFEWTRHLIRALECTGGADRLRILRFLQCHRYFTHPLICQVWWSIQCSHLAAAMIISTSKGTHHRQLLPYRDQQQEGPAAETAERLRATCNMLCGLRVNSAILKATGAGKSLRQIAKRGATEEQGAISSLMKKVIESWEHEIAREAVPA